MIRSCFDIFSSKKSDMLHTTTGAEYFFPLGRVLRIITPIVSINLMLEILIPPDKCNVMNKGIAYHGEEIQYDHTNKEPLDKFTGLNYTDYGIYIQQNIYGHHDITTEDEISFPLGILSTMITTLIYINSLLEIRKPFDESNKSPY